MRAREYVSPKSELLLGLRDRLKCAMAASAAAINGDWNVQLEDNGKQAQPIPSRSFAPPGANGNVNLAFDGSTLRVNFGTKFGPVDRSFSIANVTCNDSRCELPPTSLPAGKYCFDDDDDGSLRTFEGACCLEAGGLVSGNCEFINENTIVCNVVYDGGVVDLFQCDVSGQQRIEERVRLTRQ